MLVATGNLVAGTAGMELCDDLVGRNATHRHLFEGFRGNGWNIFPVADVGWGNATPFADAMKDRVVLVLERKQAAWRELPERQRSLPFPQNLK